jgi:hypothetical protein
MSGTEAKQLVPHHSQSRLDQSPDFVLDRADYFR